MIQSIILLLFFALLMLIPSEFEAELGSKYGLLQYRKPRFASVGVLMIILIFSLICGLRYNFGVDNLSYIRIYERCQHFGYVERDDIEPLFKWVLVTIGSMGFHYSVFNGFWGAVQIGFVLYALRKEKYLYPLVSLFVILGPIFLHWTNGVRQCTATCIFIYLVQFIDRKKLVPYLIGIFICSLIHKSAVILLPCYWLFKMDIIKVKPLLLAGALVCCTILGNTPVWVSSMENFSQLFTFLNYENYANSIDNIIKDDSIMAWGPRRLGVYVAQFWCVLSFPQIKKRFNLPKIFDIYFFAFFIGVCSFNLFSNTSHIFLRPVYYFLDFQLIIIPATIHFMLKERKYVQALGVGAMVYFYSMISAVAAFSGGKGFNSPDVYKFFFDYQ